MFWGVIFVEKTSRKSYVFAIVYNVVDYFNNYELNNDQSDKIEYLKKILKYKDDKEKRIVNFNSSFIQVNIINKYILWDAECKANNSSIAYDLFMNKMLLYLVLLFKQYGTFKVVSEHEINIDTVKFEFFKLVEFADFEYYKDLFLNERICYSIVNRCNNEYVNNDFQKMYSLMNACIFEYSRLIDDDDCKSHIRKTIASINNDLTKSYVKYLKK